MKIEILETIGYEALKVKLLYNFWEYCLGKRNEIIIVYYKPDYWEKGDTNVFKYTLENGDSVSKEIEKAIDDYINWEI